MVPGITMHGTRVLQLAVKLFLVKLIWCEVALCLSENCSQPLGLQDGRIQDRQLSASSAYEDNLVGPQNGRLHSERGGGAWCPRQAINSKQEDHQQEYLQIDLDGEYLISGIITQGRFANGIGQEFAEYVILEYWKPNMEEFLQYTDQNGNKVLPANTNTFEAVYHQLGNIIVASKIRVIPFSVHPRTVCLRVELVGCPYVGGLISKLENNNISSYFNLTSNSPGTQMGSTSSEEDSLLFMSIGILTTVLIACLAAIILVLYRNNQQKRAKNDVVGEQFFQQERSGSFEVNMVYTKDY